MFPLFWHYSSEVLPDGQGNRVQSCTQHVSRWFSSWSLLSQLLQCYSVQVLSLLSGNSSISLVVFKQLMCNNGWKATINMLFLSSVQSHMLFLFLGIPSFLLLHLNNLYLCWKICPSIIPNGKNFYNCINITPSISDTLNSELP